MNRRLAWLLAVPAAWALLRGWDAAREPAVPAATAEAVVRQPSGTPPLPAAPEPADLAQAIAGLREIEHDEPGNAFARRLSPASPAPAMPAAPAVVKPFVGPPAPPPPPPPPMAPTPPLEVIGTWEDATGLSVFLSGPATILHARTGDRLLSEYQIAQITRDQVLLRHIPTRLEVRLAVPSGGPSLAAGRLREQGE